MGLDMYLTKQVYVGANYEHRKVTGRITLKTHDKPIKVKLKRVSYIVEEVMYWRKANAIHQWFVDHVQDGNDDCGTYYVSAEKLQSLIDTCKQVLKNPELAETLLPTQSGFFFGSTNYDEWYFDDLKATVKELDGKLDESADYEYHSSW